MNGWLAAAAVVLAAGVGPTVWEAVATGPLRRRVVARNLATSLVCVALLLLAQGYARTSYADLALVLAVLGPTGTLVYARLLAEELADDPPRGRAATVLAAVATVAAVLALCVAADPGRQTAKLLVTGAVLLGGNVVAARSLRSGFPEEAAGG